MQYLECKIQNMQGTLTKMYVQYKTYKVKYNT